MPIFSDADLYRAIQRELANEPEKTESPKDDHVGAGPYAALIGGNAADIASTIYALHHGAHEANPTLGDNPSAGKLIGAKAAGLAAEMVLLRALANRGSGKAARITGYVLGAIPAGIAVHNLATAK